METHKRILVADDNTDSAATWEMLFVAHGHTVHVEYDGQCAFDAALQFHPHVALLDIGMPRMSGHEVARRIRRQTWGSEVLLLAVSGWGDPRDKTAALESGFDYHYTKPADPSEILALVESLLWRGRRRSAR